MSKEKRITPFSNGSEFMSWQSENCDKCCRYSNVSSKRCNAKCKLAFDLDYAYVDDGTISAETAIKIGCDGLYLSNRCNNFNKPIIKKKYPKKLDNKQTKLF